MRALSFGLYQGEVPLVRKFEGPFEDVTLRAELCAWLMIFVMGAMLRAELFPCRFEAPPPIFKGRHSTGFYYSNPEHVCL